MVRAVNPSSYNFDVYQPNVGNIMSQAQGIKNAQERNVLMKQQQQANALTMRDHEADRQAAAEEAELTAEYKRLTAAMQGAKDSENPEVAFNSIYAGLGGTNEYKLKKRGKTITIKDGPLNITGTPEEVERAFGYAAKNQVGEGVPMTKDIAFGMMKQNPNLDITWTEEKEKKEGKEAVFKQKVQQLQNVHPEMSEAEATGLILGTTKIIADETTGVRYLVDSVTGTERELVSQTSKEPEPIVKQQTKQSKTLWQDAELSTGPMSAAKHGASVVSGMVGGPISGQTEQARQRSTTATLQLVRALSINPRFPVGEINRIKEEINITPKIFDNTELLRNRMIAIEDSLVKRLNNEKRAGQDKTLSVEARRDARKAANDIQNFLDILGVPVRYSPETYNNLKAGEQYIDPNGDIRIKGAK